MNRRLIIVSIIGAFILMPAFAGAGDLEDLQTTHEGLIAAYNALDAEKFLSFFHNEFIGGWHSVPWFDRGKAMLQGMLKDGFANESQSIVTGTWGYQVNGNTGIAFGQVWSQWKPKDGPQKSQANRNLYIYTKEKGKWLLLASTVARIGVLSSQD